jgi:hypothetical protein
VSRFAAVGPRLLIVLRVLPLVLVTASAPLVSGCKDSTGPCCKTCRTGKPCGDTRISKSETCHVGAGCACFGTAFERFLAGR